MARMTLLSLAFSFVGLCLPLGCVSASVADIAVALNDCEDCEAGLHVLQHRAGLQTILPGSWQANLTVTTKTRNYSQTWWYDAANQRFRADQYGVFAISDLLLPASQFNYNRFGSFGEGAEANCMFILMKEENLSSPFQWLPSAKRSGKKTLDGEQCASWTWTVPSTSWLSDPFLDPMPLVGGAIQPGTTVSVCLADGVPREVTVSSESVKTNFSVSDIKVGPIPADVFDLPRACREKMERICDEGQIQHVELYRIHGQKEDISVVDRNFADADASMHLLCKSSFVLRSDTQVPDDIITHWTILANTSWGLYRKCWFRKGQNLCEGRGRAIGRQLALMPHQRGQMGEFQGQCGEAQGVWYSVPSAGRCPDTQITESCSWAAPVHKTSVSAACIAERVCGKGVPAAEFKALLTNGTCPEVSS